MFKNWLRNKDGAPRGFVRFIMVLVVMLAVMAPPREAKAQLITFDPVGWAQEAAEWAVDHALDLARFIWEQAHAVIQDLIMSAGNVTRVVAEWLHVEAAARFTQNIIDQIARTPYAQDTARLTTERTMLEDNNLCARAVQPGQMSNNYDGVTAISRALARAMRWFGSDSSNPNAEIAMFCTMNRLGMTDTSSSGSFFGSVCQGDGSGAGSDQRAIQQDILSPNAVVGYPQYVWPSTISVDPDTNQLSFGASPPSDVAQQRALAAIMYCAVMHPETGVLPRGTNARTPTQREVAHAMQMLRQAMATSGGTAGCIGEVARRMAIPANAPSEELSRVHTAQYALCETMHTNGLLGQAELGDCNTNGMSMVEMQRYEACSGNPERVRQQALAGQDVPTVTGRTMNDSSRCSQFLSQMENNRLAFIRSMERTGESGDAPPPSPPLSGGN